MRRLFLGLALAAALLTAGPATATSTGNQHVGSYYLNSYTPIAGSTHDLFSSWVQSSYNTGVNRDELNLRVETGNLPGVDGEWCAQIAFDYQDAGHYDIRIVRNCDSGSIRRTPLDYLEDRCGIVPCDMDARAVQIAMFNADNIGGGSPLTEKRCWIAPGVNLTCADWDPSNADNCSRVWGRKANGDNWYRSGGDPQDCSS